MAFIKLSSICDDPEDELFHDTAEQVAARTVWDLATKELDGLSMAVGLVWLHEFQHPEICSFLSLLSPEEAETWEYNVRNDFLMAEAGITQDDYFEDDPFWEDMQEQTWAAEESIKVTAAAAYAVNHVATLGPRASNPSPTPRRQTGGSDSEDPASADHDSHVQTYLQYINVKYHRLICWTSALEVVTAICPAAKPHIKKHTYQIGNRCLELADYPDDLTPDYTFRTLKCAALHLFNPDFRNKSEMEMYCALLHYQVRHKSTVAMARLATMFCPFNRESRAMDKILSDMLNNLAHNLIRSWRNHGDLEEVKDYHSEAVASGLRRLKAFDLSTYRESSLQSYLIRFMQQGINVFRDVIAKTSSPGLTARMATENRAAASAVLDAAKSHLALLDEDAPEYFSALRDVALAHQSLAECNRGHSIPESYLASNANEEGGDIISSHPGDINLATDSNALHSQTVATVEYLLSAIGDSLMREVYISKHVYEMKTGEISKLHGITQDKVRKYLSNAQAILSHAAAVRNIRGEDYY